jgi:acyl-[acyl carrier protein]--UDP-N-acetylglucosamine O-acyltransferase
MSKVVREQDPKETIETLKTVYRKLTGDNRSEEEKKDDRKKTAIKTIMKEITKFIKIN